LEGLRLDPARRRVTLDGTELPMSATELALLEYLLHNVGRVLSRSVLLDHVWHGRITSENVVEVYIAYLRKKLGLRAHLIQTVRGAGYRLDSSPRSR
jgi:DNA-binding response OmpR family regulator